MDVRVWAILAAVLLGVGCAPERAPDFEAAESRRLAEVLESLAHEDPAVPMQALEALRAVSPESRLPDLGLAHERDRELVVRLNRHLRAGELDEATELLRHQQRHGDMDTSLLDWGELPAALRALELYLAQKPYPNNAAARQALAQLDKHRALLGQSTVFQDFLAIETEDLGAMARMEREQIARWLLMDLDRLVLVGDPRAASVLAQIVATVGEDHPLPATLHAVARSDWTAVRELGEPDEAGHYQTEYLEIAFAMYWDQLSPSARQALGRALLRLPPCTLSGLLLHARYAALYGRMETAIAHVRELNASVQISPHLAGDMLHMVLPPAAFATPAWQTAVPGVNDFLDRIDQLRQSQTIRGGQP